MKRPLLILLPLLTSLVLTFCSPGNKAAQKVPQQDLSRFSVATFASGCFWCAEGVFESVKGVAEAVSGYAGGRVPNPTYELVGTNTTGHAETVQVYYDSTVISYATLLRVYFASQDPVQVNGQGPDNGASYRSIIFYRTPEEKGEALKAIALVQKSYSQPVAAQLLPFEKFWVGEDYHQDYVRRNPDNNYVRSESIPRIRRFQQQHPEWIKPEHKL